MHVNPTHPRGGGVKTFIYFLEPSIWDAQFRFKALYDTFGAPDGYTLQSCLEVPSESYKSLICNITEWDNFIIGHSTFE